MKQKQNQQPWNRVRQLLELDDELSTSDLLHKHIPSDRLYLVDRRRRLVQALKGDWDAEDDGQLDLFLDDESERFG